jgi:two-component system, OmpR family, sensor kinase
MSLRMRLTLGLLALAAVGLLVLDLVSYTALRSYLSDRLDQQVAAAIEPVARGVVFDALTPHQRRLLARRAPQPPSPAGGGKRPKGAPPLGDFDAGGQPAGAQLPPGTYGARLNAGGKPVDHVLFSYGEKGLPRPELPTTLPLSKSLGAPRLFTVPASDGSSPDFRAVALKVPGRSGTMVVAVPLRELTQTLDRLRTIELIVTAAVLVALAGLAWWVIKAGLRPLDRMGETADAIAAGDLFRRVEPANRRTEVGRLGLALNGMLGQIEQAFAERQASGERLRRFLADASHELRTPLSSIRGYAEIFRTGAAREPRQLAQAMQRIEDEAERMGGLVNDLLALARLDELDEPVREPVDLTAVASEACDDARTIAPDRAIALQADGPTEVLGDRNQLGQVATNLLRNAVVHTPAGTPIDVSVGTRDGLATLAVRDHGPGLESGVEQQVFERFWRREGSRHRDDPGAGLGLAIVAAIAGAHGGRVEAANAPGGGAEFTLTLPDQAGKRAAGDSPAHS